MVKNIKTGPNTSCVTISTDGKYLFYSIMKSGKEDIYWLDAKIIEELKPKGLNEKREKK